MQTNVTIGATQIAEHLIRCFSHQEPDVKARIAQALMEMADEQSS